MVVVELVLPLVVVVCVLVVSAVTLSPVAAYVIITFTSPAPSISPSIAARRVSRFAVSAASSPEEVSVFSFAALTLEYIIIITAIITNPIMISIFFTDLIFENICFNFSIFLMPPIPSERAESAYHRHERRLYFERARNVFGDVFSNIYIFFVLIYNA